MKSTILIYCADDDAKAAKALAASLRDGQSRVLLCSAGAFRRVEQTCERIVFTDGVPAWRRATIKAAHGLDGEVVIRADRPIAKQAKHRGFGRWYVMRGVEVVSGPHTREDAERLAA